MALKKKAHGTEQTSDLQIWKCRRKNIKRRADIFTDAFCVCVLCNSAAMALREPISNHITHTKAQSKDKHRCLQDWEKGRGFKPLMGLDFLQKGLREDDLTHVNVPLSP